MGLNIASGGTKGMGVHGGISPSLKLCPLSPIQSQKSATDISWKKNAPSWIFPFDAAPAPSPTKKNNSAATNWLTIT